MINNSAVIKPKKTQQYIESTFVIVILLVQGEEGSKSEGEGERWGRETTSWGIHLKCEYTLNAMRSW